MKETKCENCLYQLFCQAILGKPDWKKDDNIFCDTFKRKGTGVLKDREMGIIMKSFIENAKKSTGVKS